MSKSIHTALLVVSVLLMLGAVALGGDSPWVVAPENGDLQRIQDAIDAAQDGGVIVIRPGTYRENLSIDKPIALLGGGSGTDVDASFGRIVGTDNRFADNGRGPVCPEGLPLPDGFFSP